MQYERKNLIVLIFIDHKPELVLVNNPKVKQAKVVIDLKLGTWRLDKTEFKTWKIGQDGYIKHGSRQGVIGVYDRTDLKQLNSMIYHLEEALDDTGPLDID